MNTELEGHSGQVRTIKGRFEEAFSGDYDGIELLVSGWIETGNGDVLIYLKGSLLEKAGVTDNDIVEADIVFGREDDGEIHYEVVNIRLLSESQKDSQQDVH